MEVWIPLISACVGGLIATIPLLLGLIVQIYIHVSENRQKKREAMIQSREKWIERDIVRITELLEKTYGSLSEIRGVPIQLDFLRSEKEMGNLTEEEFITRSMSVMNNAPNLDVEINKAKDMIGGLVYSFKEDEIISSYVDFIDKLNTYVQLLFEDAKSKFIEPKEGVKSDMDIVSQSIGRFQKALRNKLISLRE